MASGGAEYLDDFLPRNRHFSSQVRTFDGGYSLRETLSTSSTNGCTSTIITLTPFKGTRESTDSRTPLLDFRISNSQLRSVLEKKTADRIASWNNVSSKVQSVNFSNGVRLLRAYYLLFQIGVIAEQFLWQFSGTRERSKPESSREDSRLSTKWNTERCVSFSSFWLPKVHEFFLILIRNRLLI